MKPGVSIAFLFVLAILAGAAPSASATPTRSNARVADWSSHVVATPEGGYRMGNPDAALKVIEYASLTCPHCAHFASAGMPQLVRKYVKSGKASFELRNYVRDPYDLVAALLSHCAGTARYFPLTHQILADQEQWTGRFGALSASQFDELEALTGSAKLIRIAGIAGLDAIAAKFGVPADRARACLSDDTAVEKLTRIRQDAARFDLTGTPSFIINGKTTEAHDWTTLDPLLAKPAGS
jgi:protein-disulfide isomerase